MASSFKLEWNMISKQCLKIELNIPCITSICYKIHNVTETFTHVIMRGLPDMLFKLDACHYAFKIQGYSDIECYSDTSSLEPAAWTCWIVFIQLAHHWTPRPKHTRCQKSMWQQSNYRLSFKWIIVEVLIAMWNLEISNISIIYILYTYYVLII